ncbi:hypothetical protein RUM4293_01647 [Ruegeria atlantica]|uniref:DDE domain-containing protein n=1 Tax=Ruegeria atlantica TaxID=81569 RepID=A0A0P1E381_9RHOB|nr:hypothetical protein RUM4293_01647 [Ruegeria atlantica]
MLVVRFRLSLGNVECLLQERGISHEAVRYWWDRFGAIFAKINGTRHYLWRAVDHEEEVLESFVIKTRDRKVALKFTRKTMRCRGYPNALLMDKLRSYGAAMKVVGNANKQEKGRWLNNRVENSHPPFRRRERAMQRFPLMRSLQKFAAVHASVFNHFNQKRAFYSRDNFKLNRAAALFEWRQLRSAQVPVTGGKLRLVLIRLTAQFHHLASYNLPPTEPQFTDLISHSKNETSYPVTKRVPR